MLLSKMKNKMAPISVLCVRVDGTGSCLFVHWSWWRNSILHCPWRKQTTLGLPRQTYAMQCFLPTPCCCLPECSITAEVAASFGVIIRPAVESGHSDFTGVVNLSWAFCPNFKELYSSSRCWSYVEGQESTTQLVSVNYRLSLGKFETTNTHHVKSETLGSTGPGLLLMIPQWKI